MGKKERILQKKENDGKKADQQAAEKARMEEQVWSKGAKDSSSKEDQERKRVVHLI